MRRKKPIVKTLPDIGSVVKALLREQSMSYTEFGKKCNWSKSTVCRLLKKRDWSMGELRTAGNALNKDLLVYYQTNTEPMVPVSELNKMAEEKLELMNKADRLAREKQSLELQLALCQRHIEALEFSIEKGKK